MRGICGRIFDRPCPIADPSAGWPQLKNRDQLRVSTSAIRRTIVGNDVSEHGGEGMCVDGFARHVAVMAAVKPGGGVSAFACDQGTTVSSDWPVDKV
jgi:hypothetical protein